MVERSNRVIAVYDGREKGGTVGTIRLVHTTKISTVISPEITHSFNTVADGASEPMPAENIQNYLDARHQLSADWSSQPQVMRKAIEIAVEWDFRQVNGFSITKTSWNTAAWQRCHLFFRGICKRLLDQRESL